jgi:hypothetical protein
MRVTEFVRRVRGEGWSVATRSGGHLELSHPLAGEMIITSATPSDHRWLANTRARMRRALPAEPKAERSATRPKRRRAAKPVPHRLIMAIEHESEMVSEPPPPRRLPGGPAGYGSVWSRWW